MPNEDLERLVAEGKIKAGGLSWGAVHENARFIDSDNHVPVIGTLLASSTGYGKLIAFPEEGFYHAFTVKLEIPKTNGYPDRVSVILYSEQKELMKRLFAERNAYFTRGGPQISYAEAEYEYWGLKAFMTLETIANARKCGITELADPKNKELIYECLPHLFGNRIADILEHNVLEREEEKYKKLMAGLGITPKQLTDAMRIGDKCTIWPDDILGGCYHCRRECH